MQTVYGTIFENGDYTFPCYLASVCETLDYNYVFAVSIASRFIICSPKISCEELLISGKLKELDGTTPLYHYTMPDLNPFYFDEGGLLISGCLHKSVLLPERKYLLLKIRSAIMYALESNGVEGLTGESSYIFKDNREIFSMNIKELEDRYVYYGFLNINPNDCYATGVMGLSECYRKPIGGVGNVNVPSVLKAVTIGMPFINSGYTWCETTDSQKTTILEKLREVSSGSKEVGFV